LMEDLLIRKLFNGVEKAVARVVDDEIDLAEIEKPHQLYKAYGLGARDDAKAMRQKLANAGYNAFIK